MPAADLTRVNRAFEMALRGCDRDDFVYPTTAEQIQSLNERVLVTLGDEGQALCLRALYLAEGERPRNDARWGLQSFVEEFLCKQAEAQLSDELAHDLASAFDPQAPVRVNTVLLSGPFRMKLLVGRVEAGEPEGPVLQIFSNLANHAKHGPEAERYRAHARGLGPLFHHLCRYLDTSDRLDHGWFEQVLRVLPDELLSANIAYEQSAPASPLTVLHRRTVQDLQRVRFDAVDPAIFDFRRNLGPEERDKLRHWEHLVPKKLVGLHWLRAGCQIVRLLRLTQLPRNAAWHHGELPALRMLLGVSALGPGENEGDIVDLVADITEEERLFLLPHVDRARVAVLEAQGWRDLIPVTEFLYDIATVPTDEPGWSSDLPSSSDESAGIIDRQAAVQALQGANPSHLMAYANTLKTCGEAPSRSLELILAVANLDRKAHATRLKRFAQPAIKALGLYPIADEDALTQRYEQFLGLHKGAAKFGEQRQRNTQAAVRVGLKYLAQTAGYEDVRALEWKLERTLAEATLADAGPVQHGDYVASLELNGAQVSMVITKAGKTLKTVPAALRTTEAYKALRETQRELLEQIKRAQALLEERMRSGGPISREEFTECINIPVMRQLMSTLVLRTSDGNFGRPVETGLALTGLAGEHYPITETLTVAHPLQFEDGEALEGWRRQIIESQTVQAFKQVFRECYRPAVDEPAATEDAGLEASMPNPPSVPGSGRYEGVTVRSQQAAKLLQLRGFEQITDGHEADACRQWPTRNLSCVLSFVDPGPYWTADDVLVLHEVYFLQNGRRMPLEQVDPVAFSEMMRDVDLVASVALIDRRGDRARERTDQRALLLKSLAAQSRRTNIQVLQGVAHIHGARAQYRVDLRSGTIEVGQDRRPWQPPRKLVATDDYIPFDDPREQGWQVVQSVLFLSDDVNWSRQAIKAFDAVMSDDNSC